jgi:NAD(P)-dependent dehydrogenase (short-subunit alcohol dehydrogenase family)
MSIPSPAGFTADALPDLTGTRAVVTGANSGIGLHTARALADRGAEVVLACRNTESGNEAAGKMSGTPQVEELDLASQKSIQDFVSRFEGPLDLLVNNAGVMTPPKYRETHDGHELQFGTNHLGHFALTTGLLPLLQAGRARVTHQTSIAARSGAIDWTDLNGERSYDGMTAYTQSKIAVGLFARELDARSRRQGWGVSSNLAHPGVSPTNLLAAQPHLGRTRQSGSRRVISLLSRLGVTGTVESAALPAVAAATDPAARGDMFYGPKRVIGGRPVVQELWPPLTDLDEASRLWEESERLLSARSAV